jgi:hypothetical protein
MLYFKARGINYIPNRSLDFGIGDDDISNHVFAVWKSWRRPNMIHSVKFEYAWEDPGLSERPGP